VTRIDESQRRVVLQVDTSSRQEKYKASERDVLQIARLRPTLDSGIQVQGTSLPGVAFRQGLRLSDVVHSVDELQPNADIHYLLIRRELPPDRRIAVVSADLAAALKSQAPRGHSTRAPGPDHGVDLASAPRPIIWPLMDELRVQSNMTGRTDCAR